jgi:signal transduction histidine kinase
MILDDLGLLPALDYLAKGVSERTGLQTAVYGRLDRRPDSAVELAVYRAVQEALNNVVRHGGDVNQATVRLSRRRSQLSCIIEDDGDGFDPVAVMADKGRTTMGLAGIRERIYAVGGSLDIQSSRRGTVISIQIPVND